MHIQSGEIDLYHVLHVDPQAHPSVIDAAYRALARLIHPDQSGEATNASMAMLNRAYAVLRDPVQRRTYDRTRQERNDGASVASAAAIVTPPAAPAPRPRPERASGELAVLTHGRYEGWSLAQLARHDPDYLRWLVRHPSGRGHRVEIERLLAGLDRQPGRARAAWGSARAAFAR